MNLNNVGREIPIYNDDGRYVHNATVLMVINSPKGQLVLYDRPEKSSYLRLIHQNKQVLAIKRFMELNNG